MDLRLFSMCVNVCCVSKSIYNGACSIEPANYCMQVCVCLYDTIDSDWTSGWLSPCRKDIWSLVHRLV